MTIDKHNIITKVLGVKFNTKSDDVSFSDIIQEICENDYPGNDHIMEDIISYMKECKYLKTILIEDMIKFHLVDKSVGKKHLKKLIESVSIIEGQV